MNSGSIALAVLCAAIGGNSAIAQAAAASPGDIDAQIAQAEVRVVQLRRLKTARDEEVALEKALALSPAPKPAVAAAAAPAAMSMPKAAAKPAEDAKTPPGQRDEKAKADDIVTSLSGFKFGAGLAFTYDMGKHRRVKSATLANGVVRITEDEDVRARLILETHYLFFPKGPFLGVNPGDWGIGPFIAAQGGPTDVIQGIGGGLMIGFKRSREHDVTGKVIETDSEPDHSSFNIGLGVFYDLGVQTLGDGIEPDTSLPAGETEIRFRKRAQSGFVVMSSFAF